MKPKPPPYRRWRRILNYVVAGIPISHEDRQALRELRAWLKERMT